MFLGVTAAVDAFLGSADSLTSHVGAVLRYVPPPRHTSGGMDLIYVCFVPSDLIRGQQIALLLLLFGGVPAALLGAGLRRGVKRPWPAAWASLFLAAVVFQLNSLAFTLFLFSLFAAHGPPLDAAAGAIPAGVFLLAITCNIWGLRSWRALQLGAHETPPRLISV